MMGRLHHGTDDERSQRPSVNGPTRSHERPGLRCGWCEFGMNGSRRRWPKKPGPTWGGIDILRRCGLGFWHLSPSQCYCKRLLSPYERARPAGKRPHGRHARARHFAVAFHACLRPGCAGWYGPEPRTHLRVIEGEPDLRSRSRRGHDRAPGVCHFPLGHRYM
jgi:hypothetical protein